jgi:diguanylate cyclase (GGDEF)-like protein
MNNFLGNQTLIILVGIGIVLVAFISLFLIELFERKKLERQIKSLENRLRTQRITYETITREQTFRIDELIAEISARGRVIQSVLNLASALGDDKLEKKDMPRKIIEGVNNVINADEIFFFEAIENGKFFELRELISKEKNKYLRTKIKYPLGIGPVGFIGKIRSTMDQEDMEHHSRADAMDYRSKDPYKIDYDICASVHYRDKMFGVIGVRKIKPLTQRVLTPEGEEKIHIIGDKRTALKYSLEALKMVSELGALAMYGAELREQIQRLADTDGLTGIYNKRVFKERLERAIKQAEQSSAYVGLFMMDIDNFKKYNDRHGHPAGDDLLKNLGKILKKVSGNIGLPARYGGEEFVVMLYNKNKAQTLRFGEMVREIIEKTKFENEETQPGGKLTISGGVAVYPIDANNAEDLIKKADDALYHAKSSGKNKVFAYKG